jgi:hypothetical protein
MPVITKNTSVKEFSLYIKFGFINSHVIQKLGLNFTYFMGK